jgi:hypothetical protein
MKPHPNHVKKGEEGRAPIEKRINKLAAEILPFQADVIAEFGDFNNFGEYVDVDEDEEY